MFLILFLYLKILKFGYIKYRHTSYILITGLIVTSVTSTRQLLREFPVTIPRLTCKRCNYFWEMRNTKFLV